MPSNFFSRILGREALVYNSYFFIRTGNYLALDFQTNTFIAHAAAYSSTAGHVVTNEKEEKYSYLGIHFSWN